MSVGTTIHVPYLHISVIHTCPILDLINKLIFMHNVMIIE